MSNSPARARVQLNALGDVPQQLAALETMTIAALAAKYRELYGEPTRSRNRGYLRKRLAWRIQELAEGGLPPSARARIAALGDALPERWRMRTAPPVEGVAQSGGAAPAKLRRGPRTDPRLPPVGTTLRRVFAGATHEVTVCGDGFAFDGQRYKTLSAVAKRITGTAWNGFLFFGLTTRGAAVQTEGAA